MKDKLQAFHDDNTWELVTQPFEINVVGPKWVYCIKYKEDDSNYYVKFVWLQKVSHRYNEWTMMKLIALWLNQASFVLS